MKILRYTISLLFVLSYLSGAGQKAKRDYVPSEVIFAADVVGLGTTLFTNETKLEFHSKIDFHHFYLAADFGTSKINPSTEQFNYSSQGTFFKVGPHVNFMPYNKHRGSIYFGLMYANSYFNDRITYSQSNDAWGDSSFELSNDNLKSRWFEANIGMNVKVAGPLYLGYMLRFKFANTLTGAGELEPLEIPGFGPANKGANFGFNYYIIYKLRFRDKPIPKRPIKVRTQERDENNSPSKGI
jgi:hypothetical protein